MMRIPSIYRLAAACLVATSYATPAAAQWSQDTLRIARHDHVAVESSGKIYFGGGFAVGQATTSDVEVYDTVTGTWSTMALSFPRWRLAAAASNGTVAFAGGLKKGWGEITDRVDLYDTSTGIWSTTHLPQAASIFSGIGVKGKLIFNRGSLGPGVGALSIAQILDLATQTWSTVDLQTIATWTVTATDGDLAFLVDGGNPFTSTDALVDIYDGVTGLWARTITPRPRGDASVAVNNGKLYVSGACSATRYIDVYDIEDRSWTTILAPGGGRCGHVSVSVGPYVIFAGGYDYFFNLSPTADILNTVTGEWATSRISTHGSAAAGAASPATNTAVIAGGRLSGLPKSYIDAVSIFRYDPSIGSNYCGPAVANSTGKSASMSAFGTDVAADSFLTLLASGLPRNQLGYFLASRTQGFVASPPGSQGNLCLAGNIARFGSKVLNSGSQGFFGTTPDLTSIPTTPPSSVLVGETWHFQAWYRDDNPGPTSNFTDGLSVTFQ